MNDAIGDYEFVRLEGNPEPPRENVAVVARPGVAGVGVWLTGRRGRPFTLRSFVDTAAAADVPSLFFQYQDLIGSDPVPLVLSGVEYSGEGWFVAVLDVRQARATALLGAVGGLNPPSRGWLVAEWDLIAVEM
jgi:hypothetical protein